MRNIDEQMSEVLNRSDMIKKNDRLKKRAVGDILAVCACLVLIFISLHMTVMTVSGTGVGEQHYGSLILEGPSAGFAIVGILAFALGVFVTLFCIHIRQINKNSRRN